jgi:chromosome segregation protein
MLKLDKMELCGFKSFCDRTEVLFREGVTAVVGPNGCGKSNLGDAINWVLGEQSPRSLRGQLMADVIFSGTDSRKATGLAEVSLYLSGANGDAASEVVLTRRLFRSGESEYLLNGARVRLRDIQELLRQHHVGARTYATIEQGRIDQILNAKPQETRLILEESAGIAGYKHKRRLTELRLEATAANLLRVNDILGEVRRQINSVKRQAAKARRYQRLRERLRSAQRVRFGLRARSLDAELDRLREMEQGLRVAETELAARVGSVDAELAADRVAVEQAERVCRDAADQLHRLDVEVERDETEIRVCRERMMEAEAIARRLDGDAAELHERRLRLGQQEQARLAAVEAAAAQQREASERLDASQAQVDETDRDLRAARAELEELRRRLFDAVSRVAQSHNRLQVLEHAAERNRNERDRLEHERASAAQEVSGLAGQAMALDREVREQARLVERLDARCTELGESIGAARAELDKHNELLAGAREQAHSADAQLRTLEDVATRFAGVSDGVRALLTKGTSAGIRTGGVVADWVEAPREVEGAVELYLQALLPTVVLEDDTDAERAAELLRSEGAGRTSLLPRTQPAGAPAVGSPANGAGSGAKFPGELLRHPRVRGRLRERLSFGVGADGVLDQRIGDALVVDNLEGALRLHREYPGVDFLAETGEVVLASGLTIAGGRDAADRGLLAHRRRIQDARERLRQASTRVAELQARALQATSAVERLERELGEERQALESGRRRDVELALRAQRSVDERERAERRGGVLGDELSALAGEEAALGRELEACASEVRDAEGAHAGLQRSLGEQAAVIDRLEQGWQALAQHAAALRAEVAAGAERREALEHEREALRRSAEELELRIRRTGEEAAAARARLREADERRRRAEAALASHLEERQHASREAAEGEHRVARQREDLLEREQELRSLRAELEQARQRARSAEMERTRAEAERGHLDELCREELAVDATQAAAEAGAEVLDQADLAAIEQQLAELREELERVGPVNILALEEFSELEARYRFLAFQKEDLERAMTSLRETIRRINRSSRERFLQAFENIRRHYQDTFRVLFGGGRADLVLEEGEDVLECGVEILAQPPGKRLSSVRLLSGGERAMSAIALLFAIFRHQPSPFCLLDEVDAPLDDSNITRFTRLLREYAEQTQFIMITHNKLSMEAADALYGVTMDEPGISRLVSLELH